MSIIPDQDNSEKEPSRLLQEAGMYVFMAEVTDETIKPIIEWILVENHVVKKKKKELLLMICSEGGSVEDAFALIDVMRNSYHPIRVIGVGAVMSAAFMIFAAGTHGQRYAGRNTSFMCHQYSDNLTGKHHDLKATMKDGETMNTRMVQVLKDATGLAPSKIKSKLLPASDVYLTAEEVLELGIADHIL